MSGGPQEGSAVIVSRHKLKLSQENLAHNAGIHRTYFSDIERGKRNPSLLSMVNLARALGVTLSVLFMEAEID